MAEPTSKRKPGTLPGVPVSCIVHPAPAVKGALEVPGDKSISHRVGMIAGLASGKSVVKNYLQSEDCISTLRAMEALGARTYALETGELHIEGTGGRLIQPAGALDCGNSGTTLRLLSGILAGQPLRVELTGDESLRNRPMKRIKEPLEAMGARVTLTGDKGTAPIRIEGARLKGIEYLLPVASAQVKSCLLLAGLFAEGATVVAEPAKTRDHTERLLKAMGVPLQVRGLQIELEGFGMGGPAFEARTFAIPGDFSSAAFWMVAAAAREGCEVTVRNVGLNPRRTALLDVLKRAGAEVTVTPRQGEDLIEESGDVTVRGAALSGVVIEGDEIPNLIDELPVLAVLGALAGGRTEIRDAAELRVKESDRIACMAENLGRMGVRVEEKPDGMAIEGAATFTPSGGLRSFGDHRIAMSMAVLALHATEPVVIHNVACVDTSYPAFWSHLEELGGHVG